PLPQNFGAEGMDGSDAGFLEVFERVFEIANLAAIRSPAARPIQLLPQAQFQFPRGLAGEGDGNDVLDLSKTFLQHRHDAPHHFGGLAGAGRGFHNEALRQRGADALASRGVVELDADYWGHTQSVVN